MQRLEYILFRAIVFIATHVSENNLYKISTFFKILVFDILGYRKKVVLENIHTAFASKSIEEQKKITNEFFQFLCDMMLETFASYEWSEKKIVEKFRFTNPEFLEPYKKENKFLICVAGHFGNFEIGAVSIPSQLHISNYAVIRPLVNTYINKYIYSKRSRTGVKIFDSKSLRHELEHVHTPGVLYLLADQSPSKIEKALWANFLNRDTAFAHGPVEISQSLHAPLIYIDIKAVRRGYYEASFSEISNNPNKYTKEELNQKVADKFEKTIYQSPAHWLWSHKRWKWYRANGEIKRF